MQVAANRSGPTTAEDIMSRNLIAVDPHAPIDFLVASFKSTSSTGLVRIRGVRADSHKRPHSSIGGKLPAVVYWRRNETIQPGQQVQRVI